MTEAGRNYLEAVERILADIDEADLAASAHTLEVHGTLRLNAPVSFGTREIAPLLPELSAAHPALAIDLGLNDRQVDLIEEGWDLVVRIGNLRDSTLIARRLAPCRLVVCAAPAYLKAHGTPRRIADLSHHNCLGYTLSSTTGAGVWRFGADAKASVRVTGNLRANSGEALQAAAVAGQGIVYQPTFLAQPLIRAGLLVALALDQEPIELDGVFAVYPADRRPPAKVRAMVDFLAQRFGPVPPWER